MNKEKEEKNIMVATIILLVIILFINLGIYSILKEYKEKFGVNFINEDKRIRSKKALLKEVWETCTFDEIITAGYEYAPENKENNE